MLYKIITLAVWFFTFAAAVSSNYAPFTVNLPAFSKECFYHDLISNDDTLVVSYQVLTGGNFEIDFLITGPDGSTIVDEKQKKYSDFLLKSFGLGQYSFCFSNSYGTALKKVEITLEKEKTLEVDHSNTEDVIANNAIEEIDRNLNKMNKVMNYLRAREWRNMSTVSSTESRLKWLSILVMLVMVGISVGQAIIIQLFFKSRQKNYV
ncbi:hypothetical protein KAFR_0K00810 [Kazachstania africana CBS 2517]|uniref:GOLD domain-containing protein n=1 Tax=Kazachstania africana (strain ATCC 22294 / BCRC 22015 / CBS 2517 / CECT 1963 / NBRC 1671 / NRRL Y-8276) TaxID=1071382 RepID=H2B1D6_KAZAF|nr:hypothetical protein KAFR_0K00810 [Kazachstania africana CBS 2517]CCF60436.1 hypothetical protein KAFR_0K00810 [Kazachstania africana CBS 2517]